MQCTEKYCHLLCLWIYTHTQVHEHIINDYQFLGHLDKLTLLNRVMKTSW